MLKLKKFCVVLGVAMSLGMMTSANAVTYSCAPGEDSLLDSYTFPNECGGMSLAMLRCVGGAYLPY